MKAIRIDVYKRQVYNTAVGDRTTIKDMAGFLKDYLSEFDPEIKNVEIVFGPIRAGDVPHSKASIEKAINLLGYQPVSYTHLDVYKRQAGYGQV